MRPGTYVPTDPREVHAFAMHRLQNEWLALSHGIGTLETAYLRLGLRYHQIRLAIRERIGPVIPREATMAALTVSSEPSEHGNLFMELLSQVRTNRDTVKQWLNRRDEEEAQVELWVGEHGLEDLQQQLKNLDTHVINLITAEGNDWVASERPDEEELSRSETSKREWLCALPEVKKSVELGLEESPEAAIEDYMRGNVRWDDGFLSEDQERRMREVERWRRGDRERREVRRREIEEAVSEFLEDARQGD